MELGFKNRLGCMMGFQQSVSKQDTYLASICNEIYEVNDPLK